MTDEVEEGEDVVAIAGGQKSEQTKKIKRPPRHKPKIGKNERPKGMLCHTSAVDASRADSELYL